ncbi:MAG TPA: cache domain-containing protein, partial [Mobilitalea sp.]|nr:cache domain-containing protein [Mobilitalea sp.]
MKLKHKLLLLTVLPVIVLGFFLFLFASNKIKQGIYQQAFNGMHATTLAVRSIFETGNSGKYYLDDSGDLRKGDSINISKSSNLVDQIKNTTGMDVTIFYNDTRVLTTIMNKQGKREINTKASANVVNTVLKKGKDYYAD